MPSRLCSWPGCGELVPLDGYQQHYRTHRRKKNWTPQRDNTAHVRFARAVKKRDGHRCRFTLEDGTRCPATTALVAHHLTPAHQGGTDDPANGVTLCARHHRHVDSHAR